MRASSVSQIILDTLTRQSTHLSAHDIYETIRQQLPAVNASTVYRALERLVAAGQVSVSDIGTGQALYERVGNSPHHHLVCQICHTTLTLDEKQVHQFFQGVETSSQFHITTNHLILFGICPDCKTKEA